MSFPLRNFPGSSRMNYSNPGHQAFDYMPANGAESVPQEDDTEMTDSEIHNAGSNYQQCQPSGLQLRQPEPKLHSHHPLQKMYIPYPANNNSFPGYAAQPMPDGNLLQLALEGLQLKYSHLEGEYKALQSKYSALLATGEQPNSAQTGAASTLSCFCAKLPLITFKQADFPNVRGWTQKAWKDHVLEEEPITSLEGNNNKLKGKSRLASENENVDMKYLEDANGEPCDGETAVAIRAYGRSAWFQAAADNTSWIPGDYRDAPLVVKEYFRRSLVQAFPLVGYCKNSWKANAVTGRIYSKWRNKWRDTHNLPPLKEEDNEGELDDPLINKNKRQFNLTTKSSSHKRAKKAHEVLPLASTLIPPVMKSDLMDPSLLTIQALSDAEELQLTIANSSESSASTGAGVPLQVYKTNDEVLPPAAVTTALPLDKLLIPPTGVVSPSNLPLDSHISTPACPSLPHTESEDTTLPAVIQNDVHDSVEDSDVDDMDCLTAAYGPQTAPPYRAERLAVVSAELDSKREKQVVRAQRKAAKEAAALLKAPSTRLSSPTTSSQPKNLWYADYIYVQHNPNVTSAQLTELWKHVDQKPWKALSAAKAAPARATAAVSASTSVEAAVSASTGVGEVAVGASTGVEAVQSGSG